MSSKGKREDRRRNNISTERRRRREMRTNLRNRVERGVRALLRLLLSSRSRRVRRSSGVLEVGARDLSDRVLSGLAVRRVVLAGRSRLLVLRLLGLLAVRGGHGGVAGEGGGLTGEEVRVLLSSLSEGRLVLLLVLLLMLLLLRLLVLSGLSLLVRGVLLLLLLGVGGLSGSLLRVERLVVLGGRGGSLDLLLLLLLLLDGAERGLRAVEEVERTELETDAVNGTGGSREDNRLLLSALGRETGRTSAEGLRLSRGRRRLLLLDNGDSWSQLGNGRGDLDGTGSGDVVGRKVGGDLGLEGRLLLNGSAGDNRVGPSLSDGERSRRGSSGSRSRAPRVVGGGRGGSGGLGGGLVGGGRKGDGGSGGLFDRSDRSRGRLGSNLFDGGRRRGGSRSGGSRRRGSGDRRRRRRSRLGRGSGPAKKRIEFRRKGNKGKFAAHLAMEAHEILLPGAMVRAAGRTGFDSDASPFTDGVDSTGATGASVEASGAAAVSSAQFEGVSELVASGVGAAASAAGLPQTPEGVEVGAKEAGVVLLVLTSAEGAGVTPLV